MMGTCKHTTPLGEKCYQCNQERKPSPKLCIQLNRELADQAKIHLATVVTPKEQKHVNLTSWLENLIRLELAKDKE